MNIKRIRFDEFGPYRDWSFTTGNHGVQLMYGPNESGKTSLLEGMRTLLFGGTHKAYGPMTGALDVERNGESYYIGRKGKQLDFYSPGNPAIHEEPAQHWWHGIDKKTYNRIFALTLDDLQGLDVLQEVEVRSRFFGAEGGEHLGSVVKDVEKGATDLLVASSNGKRRINVLMDELKENRQKLSHLAEHETQYVELQKAFHSTEQTEAELQGQLQEWKEYRDGIDQLWQEKEAALMPANFSPDSPFGTYGQDIEDLIQQGAKWEQLRRECEEGDAYIFKVREQLEFSRSMHSAWRDDEPMADDVNWFEGERLASRLRTAKDQLLHWQDRKPAEASDDLPAANLDGASLPNYSEEDLAKKEHLERELDLILIDIDRVTEKRDSYGPDAQPSNLPKWLQRISGVAAVIGVLLVLAGLLVLESVLYTIGGFILLILSMALFWYATWRRHNGNSDVSKLNYELQILSSRKSDVEHQLEALVKAATPVVNPIPSIEGAAHLDRWVQEGHTLQAIYDEALAAW
ncbi:MAG: AAA family ATPase, partial [Veillonella sp.]|nr:AAA family ATPase [Veillonella sp.]